MTRTKTLRDLITSLQDAVKGEKLSRTRLREAAKDLGRLGFKQYDTDKFPRLGYNATFGPGKPGKAPRDLAEALLWKLGKWKTSQSFVTSFNDPRLKVSAKGGVVFSAFAKHLQDPKNPIFDQHALRAVWAICGLTKQEEEHCCSMLFDQSGKWKRSPSGDDASCYQIFVNHVRALCDANKIVNDVLPDRCDAGARFAGCHQGRPTG
jgi:hypothetical protein